MRQIVCIFHRVQVKQCNFPVYACRSDWDNSCCVCSSLHPSGDHCGDRGTDVLQEGQHGQLHLKKVGFQIHCFVSHVQLDLFLSTSLLIKCIVCRKVHSAPDRLNPMFQESSVKDRPQISQPTLMASTATHACAPLVVTVTPSRPAPQVNRALIQEESVIEIRFKSLFLLNFWLF